MVRIFWIVALLFVAACSSPTEPEKKLPPPQDTNPWQPTVTDTLEVYKP